MKKFLLTPVILSATLASAPGLFAQQNAPGNPSPGIGNTNPRLPQQQEILLSDPGQIAPKAPDFKQPLPRQQGTIPEVIERPTAGAPEQMVVSPQEIQRAQQALKARGYDPGATSGNLHTGTQEALRKFQKANNLPVTGVLDQKTANKLGIDIGEKHVPREGATDLNKTTR